MKWFWKRLCLFAFRRWCDPVGEKPVGIPGHRDPDAPCTAYTPRQWRGQDWRDCQTDGHYLCKRCCHLAPDEPEAA